MRDQFLCSLLSECFEVESPVAVLRLQLITGLVVRLPVSKEAELARIFPFHCAVLDMKSGS